MAGKKIDISKLRVNEENPRLIRDEKFKKLVNSIRSYPKFLELRPIVIDSWENPVILGGNMRYRAIKELKYKEIPEEWVKTSDSFTEEEKKAFLILDNVGFGEWDNEILANQWDTDLLEAWGLDLPKFQNPDEQEEDEYEESGYEQEAQWFLNIRCADEQQCQRLYEKFIAEGLDVKIVL